MENQRWKMFGKLKMKNELWKIKSISPNPVCFSFSWMKNLEKTWKKTLWHLRVIPEEDIFWIPGISPWILPRIGTGIKPRVAFEGFHPGFSLDFGGKRRNSHNLGMVGIKSDKNVER